MTDPDGQKGATASDGKRAKIAILGYGARARERAMRLRQSGHEVSVSMRPGGLSWLRATADKFPPAPASESVASAEIVVLLVPDEEQPSVYWHNIDPYIAKGSLLVVERGDALYIGLEPRRDVDIVLVTADGGRGRSGCRVAVHHDATGHALERAISYARAAFAEAQSSLGTTTVAEEVEADLAAREERAGGHEALLAELDQVLVRGTHEPDEAKLRFYERLRAHVAGRKATDASRIAPAQASSVDVTARYWTQLRGVA